MTLLIIFISSHTFADKKSDTYKYVSGLEIVKFKLIQLVFPFVTKGDSVCNLTLYWSRNRIKLYSDVVENLNVLNSKSEFYVVQPFIRLQSFWHWK